MGQFMSESEYLTVLRLSLSVARTSDFDHVFTTTTETSSTSSDNAAIGKILAGIRFSRRFILSYQVVLLFLLAFFSLRFWIARYCSWRSSPAPWTNNTRADFSSHRSSSSSTLRGGFGCHDTTKDERSALLQEAHEKSPFDGIGKLQGRIKGWLIYQPGPIPIVNKTLPSNGCTMFILAFLGLQAFYVLYKVTLSVSMLFVFADRTALVFVANLPLLYLLAAKNQPIRALTGYSYESLNIFHRRLGEVMCLLALLHSVGMVGVWYTILRPTGFTLARFLMSKIILLGLGALLAYEALYLTSLGSFRQRWYELFLGLHVILQAAALILVWFHHKGSRPYVGAALAIFLVDRVCYRMALKMITAKASLEVAEDGETVIVHATIPIHSQNRVVGLLKPDISRGWKPTEHIFLSVPSLARKHYIQAHPFTIACAAPAHCDFGARLDLVIRAQDGFSKDLVRYAKSHSTTTIRLDGPYGSQRAVRLLQDHELCVIVSGGSGIAVTWPLVWSVLESRIPTDLEHDSAEIPLSKPVLFIWIVRQDAHTSWIGKENLRRLKDAGVETLIFPPTEKYGHPDLDGSVRSWITEHQSLFKNSPSIGLVASGPDRMNRSMRNLAASLVSAGHQVNLEIEKFGW